MWPEFSCVRKYLCLCTSKAVRRYSYYLLVNHKIFLLWAVIKKRALRATTAVSRSSVYIRRPTDAQAEDTSELLLQLLLPRR